MGEAHVTTLLTSATSTLLCPPIPGEAHPTVRWLLVAHIGHRPSTYRLVSLHRKDDPGQRHSPAIPDEQIELMVATRAPTRTHMSRQDAVVPPPPPMLAEQSQSLLVLT